MTIYVDELIRWPFKPKKGAEKHFGNGKFSCHMICDGNLDELHEFAKKIGLKREWFQPKPHIIDCHYDLTPNKRLQAVWHGAKELKTKNLLRMKRKCPRCKTRWGCLASVTWIDHKKYEICGECAWDVLGKLYKMSQKP